MKKSIILINLLLLFISIYSYKWPMKNNAGNFNGPLSVNAVLGDLRRTIEANGDTIWRLHRGIDIKKIGDVYPIYSGKVHYDSLSGDGALHFFILSNNTT